MRARTVRTAVAADGLDEADGQPGRRAGPPPDAPVAAAPAEDLIEAQEDEEPDVEAAAEAGEKPQNGEIVDRIRRRLSSIPELDMEQIAVRVERGVVVVSGRAPSRKVRQRTIDAIVASGGVTVVRSSIRLLS